MLIQIYVRLTPLISCTPPSWYDSILHYHYLDIPFIYKICEESCSICMTYSPPGNKSKILKTFHRDWVKSCEWEKVKNERQKKCKTYKFYARKLEKYFLSGKMKNKNTFERTKTKTWSIVPKVMFQSIWNLETFTSLRMAANGCECLRIIRMECKCLRMSTKIPHL